MLKDTQIIIGIIISVIVIVVYCYNLLKFVNRIDANSTIQQKNMQEFKESYKKEIQESKKEMQEFKSMMFEPDGKPKYVRSEHCSKNREDISGMIERSFKLLKYELMEAIEGKYTNTTKRIHEKIETLGNEVKELRDKI